MYSYTTFSSQRTCKNTSFSSASLIIELFLVFICSSVWNRFRFLFFHWLKKGKSLILSSSVLCAVVFEWCLLCDRQMLDRFRFYFICYENVVGLFYSSNWVCLPNIILKLVFVNVSFFYVILSTSVCCIFHSQNHSNEHILTCFFSSSIFFCWQLYCHNNNNNSFDIPKREIILIIIMSLKAERNIEKEHVNLELLLLWRILNEKINKILSDYRKKSMWIS